MKNIYLIPTDKPSRLGYLTKKGKEVYEDLRLFEKPMPIILDSENQHIYITSDEFIKGGDYFYSPFQGEERILKYNNLVIPFSKDKKIILTTDQDLIKDGVQSIPDKFLEWFVKNPSCKEVEIIYGLLNPMGRQVDPNNLGQNHSQCVWKYKIIIPKEEIFEMYEDLYGKTVKMNDRLETEHIWSEELALKNKGRWIPKEEPKPDLQKEQSKQETAVDFLHSEYKKLFGDFDVDIAQIMIMSDILAEAKKMEKEQIVKAHGLKQYHKSIDGEQYYNETYGNKD